MSISKSDIRTALTQCAKAAVLKHELEVKDLPFDLGNVDNDERLQDIVDLIDERLCDHMINYVISAVHHGNLDSTYSTPDEHNQTW